MPHLRAGGIRARCDQPEANGRAAVRALGPDRFFIHGFVIFFFQPHQLKALRTASDLRSHDLPLTLRLPTHLDGRD